MSNRLPILAAEIRRAHADVQEAAKTAAERATDAGKALIEAKALCAHGEWLPWLRDNCALAERTAQLYMKVSKSGLKTATIADLGLKAAAQAIMLHMPDPFDGDSDEAMQEWRIFLLWKIRQGLPGEGAEGHCHWLRRNGWETPSVWFGVEGDKFRAAINLSPLPERLKINWAAFLAANIDRTHDDLEAEIHRLAEAQPELVPSMPSVRRRRRRAA